MMLTYMLPEKGMREHVEQDILMIEEEGPYPDFLPFFFVRLHSDSVGIKTILLNNRGMARDNYTDALMLGTAIYEDEDTGFAEKAFLNAHGEVGEMWPIGSLRAYLENGAFGTRKETYARYWHGYLIFLKPLLLVMPYRGIRILNLIIQSGLLCVLLLLVRNKLSAQACVAFGVAVLFGIPLQIPFCIQYSTITFITLIASIILLRYYDLLAEKSRLYGLFFLIGMATSFFDLLTFPIWTLGIPMVFRIAMAEKRGEHVRVGDVARISITWLAGYGLFWGSKWILASLFTSENVIADAIRQAGIRSIGDASLSGQKITIFHSIAANLICYSNIVFLIAGVCILGWIIRNRKEVLRHESNKAYALVAVLPFIWYIVLKSHSYDHSAFTCRGLLVTAFAVLMMFLKRTETDR